jgi:hypothetical protein
MSKHSAPQLPDGVEGHALGSRQTDPRTPADCWLVARESDRSGDPTPALPPGVEGHSQGGRR